MYVWHVLSAYDSGFNLLQVTRVWRRNFLTMLNINRQRSETSDQFQPPLFSQEIGLNLLKFAFKVVRGGTSWCQIYPRKPDAYGLHSRDSTGFYLVSFSEC